MEIEDLEDLWSTASDEKVRQHLDWLVSEFKARSIINKHYPGITVSLPFWNRIQMFLGEDHELDSETYWKDVRFYVDYRLGA